MVYYYASIERCREKKNRWYNFILHFIVAID